MKEGKIMGEAVEFFAAYNNGFSKAHYETNHMIMDDQTHDQQDSWFEEEIDVHLKWSFALNRSVLYIYAACVYIYIYIF